MSKDNELRCSHQPLLLALALIFDSYLLLPGLSDLTLGDFNFHLDETDTIRLL